MAKVLRPFDYSFDGVTALKANIGDDIDFGKLSAGLVAEHYIEGGDPVVVVEPAPEPEPVIEPEPTPEPEPEPVVEPVVEPTPAPEPEPAKPSKRR